MPFISKTVAGPSGYDPTNGWLLRVGELEIVRSASVGIGSSCDFRPQVAMCSGNVVTINTYNMSGILNTASTILSSTNFLILADGI